MKNFLDDNFLLETETAETLYHKYAKDMPIFDYHSHLPPEQIAENHQFHNLYDLWLSRDHYKWRAMRSFGIDEKFITGDAEPFEKYMAYAKMIPYTIGNPLYHWTHLELQRYFDIKILLSEDTAQQIWDLTEKKLSENPMGARDLILQSNVKALCTTDDPIDSLENHKKVALDGQFPVKVLPTFRPDKALAFTDKSSYLEYLSKLARISGIEIDSYQNLLNAIENRHDYFHSVGCRLSDHALTDVIFEDSTDDELRIIFDKFINGDDELNPIEIEQIQTALLCEIALMNQRKNWAMQIHIGALRNNNGKAFDNLGADCGYDSIADEPVAAKLSKFLNLVNSKGDLPKTILYVLNPSDNYTIGTMIGNFQDGKSAGKIQFGTSWWFNDQRDGMVDQMRALSNLGLLSQFVGMLTDSRSFTSYPRHEYFRRILCNLIGSWVENGEYPWDEKFLGKLIQDICFNNARNYFAIEM